MKFKSVMMLLAVLGLTACTSSNQSTSAAPVNDNKSQTAGVEAKPSANDVLCTNERALNTRFAKKKCRTSAQIEENKTEAREVLRGGGN